MREGLASVAERLTELVRAAQGCGQVDADLNPGSVARTLMSLFFGMILQRALDRDIDLAPCVEVIRALFYGSFWRGGSRRE